MSTRLYIEQSDMDRLEKAMSSFGADAEKAISEVLHESGEDIYQQINKLIHPSGRRFKGHPSSATTSRWPRFGTSVPLEVRVETQRKYGYLYFPDDGSNTDHHRGMQEFFRRGGEAATPSIVDRCLDALAANWKEIA